MRVAVAAAQDERPEEWAVLDQRHAELAEELVNAELAVDRLTRTTLAGEVTIGELGVGHDVQFLLAVLGAEGDPDPVIGEGRLDAVLLQLARDRCVGKILADRAL